MSFAETAALGAIAGFTIFLGLPIGRAEGLSQRARVGLSMLSAGILAFLFMDVGAEGLGRPIWTPSRRTTPRYGR
jgi:ZIP family zinc transporter